MTHVKRTKDSNNEYDAIFVLKNEALYEGLREYFMSLMPGEQVHASEQIYIVPLDIVNFMLGTHGVEYIDKTTNKACRFDIEQYAHHRQFLDKRRLASHPFLFVPIYNGAHWWLWIADVKKKKFYVLNPIKSDAEQICCKLFFFYDCGIYVMKWLKTIDPRKIKSGKRYKYRAWTQEEIDDFRYQYGPNLLLHEMSKIREQVIWESEVIRLPKPSAALSNPYCKFTYGDFDSKYDIL
ncbi:hypothetical protein Ahy_B05g077249 [Arachis hypogaea]|uniref:Ubiquitin-like protease family profile domain-containing protein n=1 Tax=Arachis hypogaea TaxID=3818 RepID=A0A444Z4K1_ARAHY|nr:hypothetical protein Ahy_B05g077249 [Arachis hypogaea]